MQRGMAAFRLSDAARPGELNPALNAAVSWTSASSVFGLYVRVPLTGRSALVASSADGVVGRARRRADIAFRLVQDGRA